VQANIRNGFLQIPAQEAACNHLCMLDLLLLLLREMKERSGKVVAGCNQHHQILSPRNNRLFDSVHGRTAALAMLPHSPYHVPKLDMDMPCAKRYK